MEKIIIVVLSNIDDHVIDVLKQNLEKTFKRLVVIKRRIQSLGYAYNAGRKQYKSPRLLSRLRRIKKDPDDKIMGVTDVDLYSPEYDFVYGEAEISSGTATLSLYRLRSRRAEISPAPKVFERRIIREATHELSHLYHLGHCQEPKCVMRSCTCVAEIDRAGNQFCPQCNQDLEESLTPVTLPIRS